MSAPADTEIELAFYEKFLWDKGLTAYPVQEQAINRIVAGDSVMVTVPTGTGKTLMAKAALYAALQRGRRAVYTTPLRALTEEKYRELCDDFGEANVGFATGDYKVNREAPIQVEVAEILWNRIVGEKNASPADVVVMDEGHYFADPERGYVWEQSIIGLDPRTQLVILSATVGRADRFCHWVELTRRVPLHLIESRERKVPLVHEFREDPLIDTVRDIAFKGDVPAIIFVFGRQQCFEVARLIKSCRRFTTDEEKAKIDAACDEAMLLGGCAKELRPLLGHGIGIHHAGILPRYKQLVEELALARLIKFVVSTETIAAGINLPARTVVFPSLRKFIKNQPRMITAAEFHQMAGRAGRPQFDDRGLAIALAPEEVVSELKRELKDAAKRPAYDESKVRKGVYNRARSDAQKRGDLIWSPESHADLVKGEPAELVSKTKITAEQVLAIGLPDLTQVELPGVALVPKPPVVEPAATVEGAVGAPVAEPAPVVAPAVVPDRNAAAAARANVVEASLPPSMRLDIVTVIDNLLLEDREKRVLHKTLAQLVANMRAIGVLDEHGTQVSGQMIRELQGMDGLFIYFALFQYQLDYVELRQLVEYLIDHDIIAKMLARKDEEKKNEWMRAKLRELRVDNPQVSWDDVEAAYEKEHPRVLSKIEEVHQAFAAAVPHPELHGGKRAKNVWAIMEDENIGFVEFVEREHLEHEEGNLFSYLVRVMNFARKLGEASKLTEFEDLAERVQTALGRVDLRFVENPRW
ncbi:MAG TPA: DEAD/DEAH box helicase [Kofleriaceae bacterium]|nr:DEAD/DEAH box helicase [Kofleriaceae bacterium]